MRNTSASSDMVYFNGLFKPRVLEARGYFVDIWNGFANEDVPSPPFDYFNEKDVLDWSHHSKHRNFDVDYTGKIMPPPEAVAAPGLSCRDTERVGRP